MYWQPIVNLNDAFYRKELIDGRQSMKKVIESFDDKKFKEHNTIKPLKIMNVFINTVVEDLRKTPPNAELRATDPTAINDKKEDMELLANRKILEKDKNELHQKVGFPKYKMGYDKFKGNVEEFDKLGLNENDTDDLTFFEQNLLRLNYEIAGQSVINNVLKTAKVDEGTAHKYARDVLANNVLCGQTYVDEISGEIKGNEYIYPEEFYGIFSDREDGANDICHGWQRQVTVSEFLRRAGNDFNWNDEWPKLLAAINYCMNTKYTGFVRSGFNFDCCGNSLWSQQANLPDGTTQSNLVDWSVAFQYKIYMFYIEWPVPVATTTIVSKKENPNDFNFTPYSLNLKKKEKKEYQKESWYQEQMYKSFGIATTMTSQYLFNFGKVYHQILEGENDEYARWTCWYYRQPGTTAAEVAEEFIDIANFSFYKLKFLLYKAKPEDEQFLINELLELAKGFKQLGVQSGTNQNSPLGQDILDQIIQWQRTKSIKIRAYPRTDGKIHPELTPIHNDQRGIDPMFGVMQAIVEWAQRQIAFLIGINPMRIGANPPARESFKTEQSIIQQSYTSTSFVYRMFEYMKNHMANTICLYAQDIVNFKDAIAYKWLKRLVGEDNIKALEALDNFAPHRYGIFVTNFNQAAAKEELKQVAFEKWKEGKLTTEQLAVIELTEDYKRGLQLMAWIEKRNEKKLRKQAIQDAQIKDQMAQQEYMRQKDLEATKAAGMNEGKKIAADATKYMADKNAQSKENTKQMQVQSDVPKITAKAEAQKEVNTNKKNLEEQEPFPA